MFEKQVTALTTILKDKDIREYSGIEIHFSDDNPEVRQ